MSNLLKTAFIFLALVFIRPETAFAQNAGTTKYKCMIQMTNYMGEGAYIVISLINAKNAYEKTLYVLGPDKKWYNTLKEWNKFRTKKLKTIDNRDFKLSFFPRIIRSKNSFIIIRRRNNLFSI